MKSKRRREKSITSYDKRIKEHIEKIKKEKKELGSDAGVIEYWEKEIENLKKEREKNL